MGEFLFGAIVLVLLVFLLRAFVSTSPTVLFRALRYAGAIALAGFAGLLFFTERPAAALFVASAAWSVFTGGRILPHGWPHLRGRSRAAGSQTSSVRTAWLEMELDHESGAMRGTILQGHYAGVRLDELDRATVIELYETSDDAETRRLLEAWLDRTYGADWRAAQQEPAPPSQSGSMSRAEALRVLGLKEGATQEEVRAAHRRLMLQNHPDRGGSDYLASKINEAKDVLLDD